MLGLAVSHPTTGMVLMALLYQVECLCAEHDSMDGMIKALEGKLEPLRARRGLSRAASVAMES